MTKPKTDLQERINAFVKLGEFFNQFLDETVNNKVINNADSKFTEGFKHQVKIVKEHNGWFTKDNINYSVLNWSKALTEININQWIEKYSFNDVSEKTIAIIMAGNIPLVGFHDFISVLISGHRVLVKQSSNDKQLLPFLAKYLEHIEPSFKGKIEFTNDKLENFDAVIATGSDNTARYFEYYFKDKPSIIRKNRNSAAVLTGSETSDDLQALSNDIFRYFGLGCRNVSKLFVPRGYNFDDFFKAIYDWNPIINGSKYANNYDYNKAVYLMSEYNLLDNGFMMLKEDESYASPIATLFYEYYDTIGELETKLEKDKPKIQCIVTKAFEDNSVSFGKTQEPQLWEYADNVDTIDFFNKIIDQIYQLTNKF